MTNPSRAMRQLLPILLCLLSLNAVRADPTPVAAHYITDMRVEPGNAALP
jgi:hypothetical protein